MEEYTFKELFFQGGIAWTAAVILDSGQLQGPIISYPLKLKLGSRPNHEIKFTEIASYIIQLSVISDPDKSTKKKLEDHKMNVLEISVAGSFTSHKAALFV